MVFRVSCTDSGYPETDYNTKLRIWSSDRRHGIVGPIIREDGVGRVRRRLFDFL